MPSPRNFSIPDAQEHRSIARSNVFSRDQRLLTRSEFQRVFDHGRPVRSKHFTVLFAPRIPESIDPTDRTTQTCDDDSSMPPMSASRSEKKLSARLGLVVAKRQFRRAVTRNRVKRRIREVFRQTPGLSPVDFVVLPRAGAERLTYEAFVNEFSRLIVQTQEKLDSARDPLQPRG
ncbi:MAG: ribonuclease P protein component [Thioalkalivibrionaceae bacterium]